MPELLADAPTAPTKPAGFFTKANASQYAQLGNSVRWHSDPKPIPTPPTPPANPQLVARPLDDYAQLRLKRVRDQLDRLDRMASEATDPKQIKEIADATARWSFQEFALAGRPMPGTLRPAQGGGRGGRSSRAEGSLLLEASSVQVTPSPEATPRPIGWEYDDPSTIASPPSTPDRLPGDVTP